MKNWLAKFLSGGAGYVVIVLIALGAIKGFADHYYDKGVEDCRAAQKSQDNKVEALVPGIQKEQQASTDQANTERVEIRKEYHTGITMAQVELARTQGEVEGRKEGRNEVYNEIRKNGGCLSVLYGDDDRLLLNARSQHDRFIQAGIGKYKEPQTGAELSGRPGGPHRVPDSLAGEYPKPD